jgi:outer membrane receptor for ferrienterochelin and colicin
VKEVKMVKKQFLLSILLILIPALAFSGVVGKIAGTVKDARTGEPLIGVNIVLEGTYQGAASDVNGEYYIINIQPGKYTVKASAVGYSEVRITDVQVIPDHTSRADFTLQSEVVQGQTITITAERPLIQKDATFSASVTTAEEIENMPVNTFSEVLSLSSGVIVDEFNNQSTIHLRGGRAQELTYMVDGIYVTDPHDGAVAADVVSQGIQDLSIISGTFNAEYGEAMSGVVNIVTKEGTPRYSGLFRLATDQFGISEYDNGTLRFDATLSGPLPLLGDRASFFLSGDNLKTDTYLRYATSHVHDINGNPISRDHDFLTFQNRERYTGKIVYRPVNALKFVIGYNHLAEQERNYSDYFKEIPDHN